MGMSATLDSAPSIMDELNSWLCKHPYVFFFSSLLLDEHYIGTSRRFLGSTYMSVLSVRRMMRHESHSVA